MCQSRLYFCTLLSAPVGLFSRSWLQGTQGVRLYTTAQVWFPGGLRGACYGHSKSRNLQRNHEVAFRGARPEQDNEKPTYQPFCYTDDNDELYCSKRSLLCGSHGTTAVAHHVCVDDLYACVDNTYFEVCVSVMCVCYDTCAREFRCVRVCALVCWNPIFQLFFFFLAVLAAAAAVSCRRFHAGRQAYKPFTL